MTNSPHHPLALLGTNSGRNIFDLFDWLTSRLPIRQNARPFPVVVLEPAEGDGEAPKQYLEALKQSANEMAIPSISPESTEAQGDGLAQAIKLVDEMSQRLTWTNARPLFGSYRFPRSNLIRSIQAIVGETGPDGSEVLPSAQRNPVASVKSWNDGATLFPWHGEPFSRPIWVTGGVSLMALIAILVGGIAEQAHWRYLAIGVAVLAVVVLLLAGLSTRSIWLPTLSRVGVGSRYRWFANSSFFAVLGNGNHERSSRGFEGRLLRVFERLRQPDAAWFLLQMKTFALLEDMRGNHAKLTVSLRGLKRTTPPVIFLAGVTEGNGGMPVLSAMSDIRTRRSELHPLLVVASVGLDQRNEPTGSLESQEHLTAQERYEHWRSSLGTSQGPSQAVALPWLLRIPVRNEPPSTDPTPVFMVRRRWWWTWAWSWRSFGVVILLCAIGAINLHIRLHSTYCHVSLPLKWNSDIRLQKNHEGMRECVGVSTNGDRFDHSSDSVGLDGRRRAPGNANTGGMITLVDLQKRINTENKRVLNSGAPYVTVVYTGIFTPGSGHSDLTVSSIRDLAGAYLAQLHNNHTSLAGAIGNRMKVRLHPVNTGKDMALSEDATELILNLAKRDPTLVGVVGMGRNTEWSKAAIRRLVDAGLPVISTTNSSDENPVLRHYYGLASTNFEEALAVRAAVHAELPGRKVQHAMIIHRESGPSKDLYSREIAEDVRQALAPGIVTPVQYVDNTDIANKVRTACQSSGKSPFSLVYFAGRAEDLRGLMHGLTQGGCTSRKLLLVSGDDITKAPLGSGPNQVPLDPNITIYYTAFVHLPTLIADNADQSNGFFLLARNELGIGGPRVSPDHPLLADGQMALTFDATTALAQAAQNALDDLGFSKVSASGGRVTGSASVTSGMVLLELPHLVVRKVATGDLNFRRDAHNTRASSNRGLTLLKVVMRDGRVVSEPVCGRLNGGRPFPGRTACPSVS